jgi:phenylacetate-CoA ligase
VITQTKRDTFEIDYVSDFAFSMAEIDHIKKVFSDFLEPNLHYVFTRREQLQRGKSGKLKQFRSLV